MGLFKKIFHINDKEKRIKTVEELHFEEALHSLQAINIFVNMAEVGKFPNHSELANMAKNNNDSGIRAMALKSLTAQHMYAILSMFSKLNALDQEIRQYFQNRERYGFYVDVVINDDDVQIRNIAVAMLLSLIQFDCALDDALGAIRPDGSGGSYGTVLQTLAMYIRHPRSPSQILEKVTNKDMLTVFASHGADAGIREVATKRLAKLGREG